MKIRTSIAVVSPSGNSLRPRVERHRIDPFVEAAVGLHYGAVGQILQPGLLIDAAADDVAVGRDRNAEDFAAESPESPHGANATAGSEPTALDHRASRASGRSERDEGTAPRACGPVPCAVPSGLSGRGHVA